MIPWKEHDELARFSGFGYPLLPATLPLVSSSAGWGEGGAGWGAQASRIWGASAWNSLGFRSLGFPMVSYPTLYTLNPKP